MNRGFIALLTLVTATASVSGCTKTTTENTQNTPPRTTSFAEQAPVSKVNPTVHTTRNAPRPSTASKPQTTAAKIDYKNIRGVFLTHDALVGKQFQSAVSLIQRTGLNGMVFDIKDDSGNVFLDSNTKARIQQLRDKHIYTIARFVVFKDAVCANQHPSWCIRTASGRIWTQNGTRWVDPTNPNVQSYNIALAKKVANLGVDEVQFDYVRFPDANLRTARFYQAGFTRSNVIAAYLKKATPALHGEGVKVSADVFGLVTTAVDDMGIGQLWEKMSPNVDVISPMMYPSHYAPGSYGVKSPVHNPHTIIEGGLRDALRRNGKLQKSGVRPATIRPWLQDFDMKASYGATEVAAQINAGKERGIHGYLLWNQGSQYTQGSHLN